MCQIISLEIQSWSSAKLVVGYNTWVRQKPQPPFLWGPHPPSPQHFNSPPSHNTPSSLCALPSAIALSSHRPRQALLPSSSLPVPISGSHPGRSYPERAHRWGRGDGGLRAPPGSSTRGPPQNSGSQSAAPRPAALTSPGHLPKCPVLAHTHQIRLWGKGGDEFPQALQVNLKGSVRTAVVARTICPPLPARVSLHPADPPTRTRPPEDDALLTHAGQGRRPGPARELRRIDGARAAGVPRLGQSPSRRLPRPGPRVRGPEPPPAPDARTPGPRSNTQKRPKSTFRIPAGRGPEPRFGGAGSC